MHEAWHKDMDEEVSHIWQYDILVNMFSQLVEIGI